MLFYFGLFILLIAFSVGRLGSIKQKYLFMFLLLILYLLATIRSLEIGNDTRTYYNLFEDICRNHNLTYWSTRYEWGYLWLMEIVSHLTNNFWVFLAIINAIVYYAYYKFFERYSINPVLSVFLFFALGSWGQTMNIIRLQLALAMMIYAYFAKENRKKFLMVFFVILAVLFQRISIVYILAFFIPRKVSKKMYLIFGVGAMGCYFFLPRILGIATSIMPSLNHYLTSSTYVLGDVKLASIIGVLMRFSVFVFAFYVFTKNKDIINEEQTSLLSYQINLVYISMFIMVVSLRFNLLDRCNYFFWTFAYLLIPNIIKLLKNRENKGMVTVSLFGLCIAYFVIINVFRPEWNNIYPYTTVWFN